MKGAEEVEVGEEDKSGALTQQAGRGSRQGRKLELMCECVSLKAT